jgi:hypothetical protein
VNGSDKAAGRRSAKRRRHRGRGEVKEGRREGGGRWRRRDVSAAGGELGRLWAGWALCE